MTSFKDLVARLLRSRAHLRQRPFKYENDDRFHGSVDFQRRDYFWLLLVAETRAFTNSSTLD